MLHNDIDIVHRETEISQMQINRKRDQKRNREKNEKREATKENDKQTKRESGEIEKDIEIQPQELNFYRMQKENKGY